MAAPKAKRPKKPNPNFPLFPHISGSWTAVIDGKNKAFGGWSRDTRGDAAKIRYDEFMRARREGGQMSPVVAGPIGVEDLFGRFLDRKGEAMDAGRIEPRSYGDYKAALTEFAKIVGVSIAADSLQPGHFGAVAVAWTKRMGPHAYNRNISNLRTAFKWAEKNRLIPRAPWYGDQFDKLPIRDRRRATRATEAEHGKRLLAADEIRKVIRAKTGPQLRAMVLLGLNCGFLAIDCARLTKQAIDIDGAWLEFVRQKTETFRAAALWPETVKALRAVLAQEREGVDLNLAALVFLTKRRRPWVHDNITRTDGGAVKKVRRSDAVNQAFGKLLKKLKIKREGVNFSSLRKTYRTAADELGDRNAVLVTMGHSFSGMDEFYVRAMAEPRLRRVSDHARKCLMPKAGSLRGGIGASRSKRGRKVQAGARARARSRRANGA